MTLDRFDIKQGNRLRIPRPKVRIVMPQQVKGEDLRFMSMKQVKTILLCAALLSLGAAIYIGADLYAGLTGSGFTLVRGQPITSADSFRYKLAIAGEGLSILAMLGCAGLMLKILRQLGKS